MFRKKDLIIIISLLFLLILSATLLILNRQQFKIGDTNAIIDNDSGKIFVSLPESSSTIQNIYFNFPFKNDSVYIKNLSGGSTRYSSPEETKLINGKAYDFKNYISHSLIIIKSGKSSIEYDLWITTGDVPILTIETEKDIPDEPKIDCDISILSMQDSGGIPEIASEIELIDIIENVAKHSYSLNIKENRITGDVPQILDIKTSKRFRLSALYPDSSLLRQSLAWDIYSSLSDENIAPESRFVEVYLNCEYKGVYLLSRRVDRNMFSIANYNIDNKEHGVIYEASNRKADYSNGTEGFSQIEPDYENDGPYFEPLEKLIDFITKTDKESFFKNLENIIDIDNLIDNHILFLLSGTKNELASNQYIYCKNEEDSKYRFYPGSYYTAGFGIDENSSKINPSDIFYPTRLYNRLYEDEKYREKLKERWNNLRKNTINEKDINSLIDKNSIPLSEAWSRNFKQWSGSLPEMYNEEASLNKDTDNIKIFIAERISWLDNYINHPPLIKIGGSYAFIDDENRMIHASLPENSDTLQEISWEFDNQAEIFIEPLSCGKYINFKNDFDEYRELISKGEDNGDITIFIDDIRTLDGEKEKLKIVGWAINNSCRESTGIEKVLISDGPLKTADNFLGESRYSLKRDDVAEHFSNENYTYSGFDILIDTLYLKNGIHEFYIYAYDKKGNYSVKTAEFEISNKNNEVFILKNTELEKLTNGEKYDFKEFIFHGALTIKSVYGESIYDLFVTTGDIPIVLIDTDQKNIPILDKINADMKIIYFDSCEKNFINRSKIDFKGKIGIRTRGKSTLGYPKKQYAVEVRDEDDNDKNASLLGMPKESDWILSAPYGDKTLIRNALAFEISNQIGLYAPRTKFVEVFLNEIKNPLNNYGYKGLYVLTENIKRNKNRVDIEKLTSDDENLISGGYLLEISTIGRVNPHESYIKTRRGIILINKYPKQERISEKQKEWITNYMNEFEDVLYSEKFNDPEEGYLKYIDIDSFIDFIIINELFKNKDIFEESTFISKERNGKLKLGPVWDFNLSTGNSSPESDAGSNQPERFVYPARRWCNRLFLDPYFVNKYINRWHELRENVLSDENIENIIDSLVYDLSESQARNFNRWQILGKGVWPNPEPYSKTHDEEINKLKNWFFARTEWIENNIDSLHTYFQN
jgi:spore coat protein CotH